jgi:hypothetical protein
MGTRHLTKVFDSNNNELLTMYGQWDGYPSGHGQDLKDLLADFQICNGISKNQDTGKWANGMGCLAAQIVAHFKKEIGSFYIYRSGTTGVWEEYIYEIRENENHTLDLKLTKPYDGGSILYSGPIRDFDPNGMF